MRLKALCWSLAALTAFLLLSWPALVGVPPKGSTNAKKKEYVVKTEIWFAALIVSFLGTTISAALVVRQTRQEYLKDSAENLKSLIEGTLQDHRKKSDHTDEQP